MTFSHTARLRSIYYSVWPLILCLLSSRAEVENGKKDEPPRVISIFDGKSLKGWTAKVVGLPLGVNFQETFRVTEGLLCVDYSGYHSFRSKAGQLLFGHLFYEVPHSHYRLELTYRFIGGQLQVGPGWAYRNSGIFIHSQKPDTMELTQEFPSGIEVQLLGTSADYKGKRTTLNVCTPSTHIKRGGAIITRHVINSTLPAAENEEWMTVAVEVRGDLIRHYDEDGNLVMEYEALKEDKTPLTGGYIALQAESHAVQFRDIRLTPLRRKESTKPSETP